MIAWGAIHGFAIALGVYVLAQIGLVIFRSLRAGKKATGHWTLTLPRRVTVTGFGSAGAVLVIMGWEVAAFSDDHHEWWEIALTLGAVGTLLLLNAGVRGHIVEWRPRGTPPAPASPWMDMKVAYSLFFLAFVVPIIGLTLNEDTQDELRKTATRNCERNNSQDKLLSDLLKRSAESDPGEPPLTERKQKLLDSFLKRLKPEKCPSPE